jgi:enoyl-CoA hydratase/carnithine racemase
MDLEEAGEHDAAEKTAVHEKLFSIGARATKPVVSAVRGPALGGGVGLIANAHVVIAAQGVSFGLTEIRIGMWPFVIFTSLRRALGERRSIELALTGRLFSVNEALQWGLVHELTQPLELEDRAYAVAAQLANSSSTALHHGLDYVHRSRDLAPEDAVALAADVRRAVFESDDFREGLKAFQEKRPPDWPSHRT